MSDFFDTLEGTAHDWMATPRRARLRDEIADVILAIDPRGGRLDREAVAMPRQRVLVVGVEVPRRGDALRRITAELARSRHEVVVSTVPMAPKGKFENVDDAIAAAGQPLAGFDWLIVTDDDVGLPPRFTDHYLAAARLADLVVSQPAHRYLSYATYQITRRRRGRFVRQTNFIEIGPLTVIRRDGFEELVPFPPSRWAYGIDLLWAELCRRHGWRMGVVDAVPVRHLKPVGGSYDIEEARREGRELIDRFEVRMNRAELFAPGRELIGW